MEVSVFTACQILPRITRYSSLIFKCSFLGDCQERDLPDVNLANFTGIAITSHPGNIFPMGKKF